MLQLAAAVFVAVILLLVDVSLGCSTGWSFFNGNCYKFVASKNSFVGEPVTATWSDARMVCLRLGGDLASVHTPAENDFIRSKSRQDVWIGYTEHRSGPNPPLQFQWTDGTSTSFDYLNWAHKQPHYPTNGESMVGCAYMIKGIQTRRRRQDTSTVVHPRHHVYSQPGQWYASSHCSTLKKQYVCKRPACCYDIRTAVADLVPNLDTEVKGTVTFQQNTLGGSTVVRGVISGLKPRSKHGFHIHTSSDQSNACHSYGGHYNPYHHPHGGPSDVNRHVGDLGNIQADENGVASFTMQESLVTLYGPNTVLGRGVVVHAGEDDLGRGGNIGSTQTGNAGGRLACGPIICRSCFDTLSAIANVKSDGDDVEASGHFTFYQQYQMGFTKQLVAYQTISTKGSYNRAQFATIQHEDFVKNGKKCNTLSMKNMTKEPANQVSHGHHQGSKSSQTSFNTVAITSFIGTMAVYKLSYQTDDGTETQSVNLCGMVWPAPHYKCACVVLQANNGRCGELCFRQQTCGGPVTVEGKIEEACLSADNKVAGLSGLDYAIPADQCMDADYHQIVDLPVQRDSKGAAHICGTSAGFSLQEPSSLAGRTFLLHDSDGDPVSCGVTEYRESCPKTDCLHNR